MRERERERERERQRETERERERERERGTAWAREREGKVILSSTCGYTTAELLLQLLLRATREIHTQLGSQQTQTAHSENEGEKFRK